METGHGFQPNCLRIATKWQVEHFTLAIRMGPRGETSSLERTSSSFSMTSIVCESSCTSLSFSRALLNDFGGESSDGFDDDRLLKLAPYKESCGEIVPKLNSEWTLTNLL